MAHGLPIRRPTMKRILVVEDNEVVQDILPNKLTDTADVVLPKLEPNGGGSQVDPQLCAFILLFPRPSGCLIEHCERFLESSVARRNAPGDEKRASDLHIRASRFFERNALVE